MYLIIILKTIFIYFFIALSFRLMGKKEVGELGIIDLIVSIFIAELGALCIENANKSIFISIVPIAVLVCIQIIVGYLTLKNQDLRDFIEGKPSVIIKDGKIKFKEMMKLRYTLDDLISQLREQGIKSIEEVNYAILENNGKLSVFKEKTDYPLPIILDGKIDFSVLSEIGKDEYFIHEILKENHLKLEDVFYAFYTKKRTFIIKKSDLL